VPPVKAWYDWWTRTARYIVQLRADGKPDPVQLAAILDAERIYDDDGPVRWEVEARTLARESNRSISTKCGLSPDRVRAYQQLFFGVEDRLAARDYIHLQVIGTGEPWLPTDVGKVWLYFGYAGGPAVLDQIISHFKQVGLPNYGYLLSRSPETRDRSIQDLKWESVLRLQLAEITPRQATVLAGIRDRRADRVLPRQPRGVSPAKWVDDTLAELLSSEPPTAAPQPRHRRVVARQSA
jgi:hypothetical protein